MTVRTSRALRAGHDRPHSPAHRCVFRLRCDALPVGRLFCGEPGPVFMQLNRVACVRCRSCGCVASHRSAHRLSQTHTSCSHTPLGDVGVVDADALLYELFGDAYCIDWSYGGQVGLFVVCCLLFVVCCLLFVVCCLLCVCCSMFFLCLFSSPAHSCFT